MATRQNASETTPLLNGTAAKQANGKYGVGQHEQQQPQDAEPPIDSAEDVQAAADAIKKGLPRSMVLMSLVAAFSCLIICAIDSTLILAITGPLSSDFNASDRVFWVNAAYMLSMGSFAPIFGRLSDITSRKVCCLFAVSTFAVGTLLCAVAPSMNGLIFARAIQGVGAAGIQPSSAIIINDLIPLRIRGTYQATGQLVFSVGYAMGGTLGGLLNDAFGWRVAFSIQLIPICLSLFLLGTFLRLPVLPKTAAERERQAKFADQPLYKVLWSRLDPFGALLFVAAIMALLVSLSLLSAYDLAFSDARFLGGLLASFALLAIFLVYEVNVAEEPLMPMRFLKNRSLSSIWCIYFIMSAATPILFYLPFYFIVVLGQSSAEVGLHYLPVGLATLSGSFMSGGILRATGKYWWLSVTLAAMFVVSPAYLATWTSTNRPTTFGQNFALVPGAFGGSALNTVLMVAVMAVVGQQDAAGCISLLYVFRTIGTIVGLSVFGSLIQKVLISELSRTITGKHARETIDLIRKNVAAIANLPAKEKVAAIDAYAKALQIFQILIAALSIVNLACVMLIKERSLDLPSKKVTGQSEAASTEEAEGAATTEGNRAHVDDR